MAKPLLPDELWAIIKPILPECKPSSKGGQLRLDERKALAGIKLVLKKGNPWEDLPQEMGRGYGITCRQRLRDRQTGGIWDLNHKALLERLRKADQIDWSRVAVDSIWVRAAHGGEATGAGPVDRAKPGTTHRTTELASLCPRR